MGQMLEVLPIHLRAEISEFLYKDAIKKIKLLQNRDKRFYADFLFMFEPMSIKAGTIFCQEGHSSKEVFFLLKGCVESVSHGKFFLEGTIIGEVDIIMKGRRRLGSFKARGDCYMLRLDKDNFMKILEEFDDIREDIRMMVFEREKKRLEELHDARVENKQAMLKEY